MVQFLDKDVDPFDKEIRSLPNCSPLTVSLASDQIATNLLDFSGQNIVTKYNSIKFFDSLSDVLEILQGLRVLAVNKTLDWIN